MYAKLKDNKLEYAPQESNIILNGRRIFNPQPQDFLNAGYKELVYSELPQITEYQYLETEYVETENKITAIYKIIDMNEEEKTEVDKNKQEEAKAKAQQEILAIKQELSETDYKCLKYVDGALSEEEYASVREYRQSLRDKINELEKLV